MKVTERQLEALKLRVSGLDSKEAAKRMGINRSTYLNHVHNARRANGLMEPEEILGRADDVTPLLTELLALQDSTLATGRSDDVRKVTKVTRPGRYEHLGPCWGRLNSVDLALTLLRGYLEEGSRWRGPEGAVYRVVGEQMEPQRLEAIDG